MNRQLLINSQEDNQVIVKSAVPLNVEEKSEIKNIFEEKLKREITLTNKVDKSLIAGLYIRFKDQVFDGSLRVSIERIKERLF